jgi:pimeloyl-ACP methyl ester carboxylesterase
MIAAMPTPTAAQQHPTDEQAHARVTSQDGTVLAFDRAGTGPAVVLVDGALCHRRFGPAPDLAPLLATHFTVFSYDRRGRGDSGDTKPYAVAREVEDLAAVLRATGGSACVLGVSSGAALALEAARRGLPITKLALYEAPFVVDATRDPLPTDYLSRLQGLIDQDRRSDAVKMFLRTVGAPALIVALMPLFPMWPKLKAVAHTLPYDISIVKDDQRGQALARDRWAAVDVPVLVLEGGKSPPWMRNGAAAIARALPRATLRSLPGQTHMVKAKVVAPVLTEFFSVKG